MFRSWTDNAERIYYGTLAKQGTVPPHPCIIGREGASLILEVKGGSTWVKTVIG